MPTPSTYIKLSLSPGVGNGKVLARSTRLINHFVAHITEPANHRAPPRANRKRLHHGALSRHDFDHCLCCCAGRGRGPEPQSMASQQRTSRNRHWRRERRHTTAAPQTGPASSSSCPSFCPQPRASVAAAWQTHRSWLAQAKGHTACYRISCGRHNPSEGGCDD